LLSIEEYQRLSSIIEYLDNTKEEDISKFVEYLIRQEYYNIKDLNNKNNNSNTKD